MAKKEFGGKSSQQNDFLEPKTPTITSAIDVGTDRVFNDGAATVSFTLPVDSPPATSYTITATSAGQTTRTATGSTSPVTIVGLTPTATYAVTMTASNAAGTSTTSNSVNVTITTVPGKPGAPGVTTQVNQDNVTWAAPATGGKTISNYQWESNDAKGNTTTSTSVAVAQEGGTSQAYRVRAFNANGWGEWSDWSGTITTTPPFFPYFPPRFPFFPPYFRAGCIAADTMIMTSNGLVAAKDLSVGDMVLSFEINEKEQDSESGNLFLWSSDSLSLKSGNAVETEVIRIIEKTDSAIIYFNDDVDSKYSITQPVFIRSGSEYKIRTTGSLEVGDFIVNIDSDGNVSEEEILDITIEEDLGTVYQIDCEPYQWFIAGGYLVHNK